MFGSVASLSPIIAERAAAIEAAGRIPDDLLDDLRMAGCFRILLPSSHGGVEATLSDAIEVIELLSRADASVGWAVAIGAGAWCDLTGLRRDTFDAMYDTPDRMIAGVFSPSGTATAVADGFEVTGRWAFASGSPYADWLYGIAIETVDDEPSFRTVLFRPDEVEIEDTWHVVGMRATASHHFHADRVTIPAERTFATFTAQPCLDSVIVTIPIPSLFSLIVASVALGAARGALDDLQAVAAVKTPLLDSAPLVTNKLFQHDLAQHDTSLCAARALVRERAHDLWTTAQTGSEPTEDLIARTRAAAVWATVAATAATETAFRLAGSSSIFDDGTLQRRLRDVNVIGQHFLVKPDALTSAGALLVGQPLDIPVF